jgi:hypothetical protein
MTMSVESNRPRTITLVLSLLILIGTMQAVKLVALVEQSALLLDLHVVPDPRLRIIGAAVWMASFWVLAVILWRKNSIVRWLVPLFLSLYALFELIILALFAKVPISEQRWIQYGIFAVSFVLFVLWALNRTPARIYYSEEKLANVSQ